MIEIIKKINIEKLILISIMVILIGIPVITFSIYTPFFIEFDELIPIKRFHILWLSVPFLVTLYILDLIINKKKINYVDILIYLLIILGIMSTIFAVDAHTSIYGANTRNEGLLSLLSYYFILLNFKNMTNEKYKKIVIKTLIILGVIQVIYGILQVYTNFSFIVHFSKPYMASGLSGNPNFLGSLMVMLASFMFALSMLEDKKKYVVLSVIFFMGICISTSTGPFISFLLVLLFFIIYYRKKIKWKRLLIIFTLFTTVYFATDYSVKYLHTNVFKNKIDANYNITSELKNLNLSNLGNGRVKIWKDTLPLVKKYWAFGAGLDNFGFVYGVRNGIYYDKAHNVYLQMAVTNGVFALITYLVLISIIFFKGLKIKDKIYIALFMAFIGYSIQAFTNISVIEVAPAFFIICGLLFGIINKKTVNE